MTEFNNLDFLAKYKNLDKFQTDAFHLINNFNQNETSNNENILITAHTGSGKSLIAEYSIYNTINNKKKKVIYTSPIKALSNQKFYDFNDKFNKYNISIGLLTGDIKYAPNSDCLIMTTEILLNLLINNIKNVDEKNTSIINIDFNDIESIIFDEVHYINDIDRGNIWEQCLMYIPKHIQIIMLSATLNNPEKFGNWVSSIQDKPTRIISTIKRVVPLYFNLYNPITNGIFKNIPKNDRNILPFNKLIPISNTISKNIDIITYEKFIKFNKLILEKNKLKYWKYSTIINQMIKNFQNDYINEPDNNDKKMFPLLFFVLNKKKCSELAKSINIILNTSEEQQQVEDFINHKLRKYNLEYLKNLEQFKLVQELAIDGICIHHSGLLPIIKEIIEILYNDGLIKVLFATETFSVGLNMPTKTVVFTDLSKYSYNNFRFLYSHEFIQMAGRAGRRNIDTKGYIILLPQLFKNKPSNIELKTILNGSSQAIQSKLNIDELLILKLIKIIKNKNNNNNNNILLDDLIKYIKNSMLSYNNDN